MIVLTLGFDSLINLLYLFIFIYFRSRCHFLNRTIIEMIAVM